eukprot:scaffold481_cov148-Skeletonema_menzelii.AAC.2
MAKTKRNKKRSRGGIGCLIAEDDSNNSECSRSTSSLLRVEDVPLSRAFSLIDTSATISSNADASANHNNLHFRDQRRVRIVHPYPYTFAAFAKSRWIGRSLIDVYHDEFGSYPRSYYEAAIDAGRILVSGKRVTCDYAIKQGDELTHTVHRHEPAVSLSDLSLSTTSPAEHDKQQSEPPPIEIVYEDDTILVVDKPASMPIHACGAYNYNTLLEVLAHWKPESYGTGKLFTVHRLDRLTSGLVLIAKSSSLASSLGKCILERDLCDKVYLARVKGRFCDLLQHADHPWRMKYWSSHKIEKGVRADESAERQSKQQKIATVPPISHGEVAGHDACDLSGGVTVELPLSKKKGNKKEGGTSEIQSASISALGFWVTDCHGNLVENATLQDCTKQCEGMTTSEILEHAVGSLANDDVSAKGSINWFLFACPCRISSHKNGVCEAGDFSSKSESELEGTKPAQTAFTLLSYDKASDTSLLLVKPDTGRMHQIRLHLQALGHPIANDHCYGGDLWFGDDEGQQACQNSRECLNMLDKGSSDAELTLSKAPATDEEVYQVVANKSREDGESMDEFIVKTCVWCARCRGLDGIHSLDGSADARRNNEEAVFRRTLMEYLVRSQGIWLHALQYSLHGNDDKGSRIVKYRTKLPSWVNDFDVK